MGEVVRRTFVVGDLVTIAPYFRNTVLDFDFEKYIVYWTNSPVNNYYKGMWNGDHLVKIENYDAEKLKIKKSRLHIMEL